MEQKIKEQLLMCGITEKGNLELASSVCRHIKNCFMNANNDLNFTTKLKDNKFSLVFFNIQKLDTKKLKALEEASGGSLYDVRYAAMHLRLDVVLWTKESHAKDLNPIANRKPKKWKDPQTKRCLGEGWPIVGSTPGECDRLLRSIALRVFNMSYVVSSRLTASYQSKPVVQGKHRFDLVVSSFENASYSFLKHLLEEFTDQIKRIDLNCTNSSDQTLTIAVEIDAQQLNRSNNNKNNSESIDARTSGDRSSKSEASSKRKGREPMQNTKDEGDAPVVSDVSGHNNKKHKVDAAVPVQ